MASTAKGDGENSLVTPIPAAVAGGSGGKKRGAFIVLEGLDRSGKTTQVKLLQTRFVEAGKEVRMMRFPDRTTPTGQIINAYLSHHPSPASSSSPPAAPLPDQAIHLLFTANRWEAAPRLAALLARGVTVVCDRYYYSGMVYSAAKRNPGLPLSWARRPEVGLPRPDLVLFLDLSPEAARRRGGWGEERYEQAEMQERVKGLFWGLKGGRVGVEGGDGEEGFCYEEEKEDLVVVDAGGSVEAVADEVWRIVRERVEEGEKDGLFEKEVRRVS